MGSANPAFAIAVLLFLFAGVALVLFDKLTRRALKWVSSAAVVALGLSLLALVLAVCFAVLDPYCETPGTHGVLSDPTATTAESR